MPNVFDISDWESGTTYKKNNVVKHSGNFFYSLVDSNGGNTPAIGSTYWGGIGIDPVDNSTKPEFIWLPSYGGNIDLSPRVKIIQYNDGYSQLIPDGINSSLLTIEYLFEGRDENEALAIIHFLRARNGTQTFLFTPSPPFAKKKRFKCLEFPIVNNFYNNFTTRAVFREVVV